MVKKFPKLLLVRCCIFKCSDYYLKQSKQLLNMLFCDFFLQILYCIVLCNFCSQQLDQNWHNTSSQNLLMGKMYFGRLINSNYNVMHFRGLYNRSIPGNSLLKKTPTRQNSLVLIVYIIPCIQAAQSLFRPQSI